MVKIGKITAINFTLEDVDILKMGLRIGDNEGLLDVPEVLKFKLDSLEEVIRDNKEVKVFTEEQVFDLLLSMQQGICPKMFSGDSQELESFDFLDLPLCKAQELGIAKEYISWANKKDYLLDKYEEKIQEQSNKEVSE